MPYLPTLHHVKKIIELRPKRRKSVLHQARFGRAAKHGDQRFIAVKLPVIIWVLQHAFVQIDHNTAKN